MSHDYFFTESAGSIEDPYTFHFLRASLAMYDTIDPYNLYKEEIYSDVPRKGINKIKVIYEGEELTLAGKKQLKGGISVFEIHGTYQGDDYIPIDSMFTKIWRIRPRSIMNDFSDKPERINKTYKECHGGGWYSKIPIYTYRGIHYAPIECSSTMNAVYMKEAERRVDLAKHKANHLPLKD